WLWADESFTLYDRPHAFLFTRVSPITDEQAGQVLRDRVHELGLSDGWLQGMGPDELDRAAQGQAPGAPGAPSALATDAGPPNPNFGRDRGSMFPLLNPVLAWWLLVAVLGWLALPLCLKLFGSFPAGGYALGRALGVLLFGWLAYNLAWIGLVNFTQGGLWMVLAALSAALTWGIRKHRHGVVAWAKANRSEILFTEGVFAAAFIGFVVVRAFNPNIHDITGQGYFGGGEPLGMTYLSAISRCVRFPAYDPWLAGQNSSYYYFGYVLAAALTKLSGYPPAVTYSLSLALFFSLTTVTAFGLLRGLVGRRWAALGGAAMVSMAGSLWSVAYLAIQCTRGSGLFGAWFSHGFIWDPTRFPELVNGHIFEFPYFSYLYGDLHPHNIVLGFSLLLLALLLVPFLSKAGGWRSVGTTPGLAWLWLLVTALVLDAQYAINTWSWPVFVALGFGCFVFGPWAGKPGTLFERLRCAALGAAAWGLALGIGRVLMFGFRHYYLQNGGNRVGVVQPNEWQMSAYIPLAYFLPGLVALALLGGERLRAWAPAQGAKLGWQRLSRRVWWDRWMSMGERLFDLRPVFSVAAAAWLLALALLLGWSFLYFDNHGVLALAAGLGLACVGLFCLGAWSSGVETWLWILGAFTCFLVAGAEHWFVADRMNTIFKFWMNGWVLMGVVFGAGLASALDQPADAALRPSSSRKRPAQAARGRRGTRSGRRPSWVKRAALGLWALVAGHPGQRPVRRWAVAGLLALVAGAAWFDAGLLPRGGRFMVSYLAFAALLLGLVFFGALYGARPWWQRLRQGALLGLLALGLLYPVGATVERIIEACDHDYSHPRLDGLAFMAQRPQRPEYDAKDYDLHDYALIQWLNKNAPVTETVLEAPGTELYKGYSRFAIYTGLPTLVGWEYQVSQQLGERTGNLLNQRERDAATMYGPDDAAAVALLRQYKVRWVVVGGIERKLYPAAGLDKFAHLATVAVQDGPSVLYRFDWDRP
ncbi:MAG TPA: DUF2298 domain-containing protein, partial [bacterium]|nr:DUF2298 domain-containing protein [bacterium]